MSVLKLCDGTMLEFSSKEQFLQYLKQSKLITTGNKNTDYFVDENGMDYRKYSALQTASEFGVSNEEWNSLF